MEWSTTSNNVENVRISSMPSTWPEFNSFNLLNSFSYDPYNAEDSSYKPTKTQTGPVISIPAEKIKNPYRFSNNNEMIKKKRLTSEQLASLEQSFQEEIKLDSDRKLKLSKDLGLQPRQIAVWFQNRRVRWKAKQLEKLYDSLRQQFDAVSREKQMLHEEVKKLRAKLRDQGLMSIKKGISVSKTKFSGRENTPEIPSVLIAQSRTENQNQITDQITERNRIYDENSMLVASSCWPPYWS